MSEPTEAEIEAAAIALFVFDGNTEEEWRNMVLLREHGKDGWRRQASAALTAAAQVRAQESVVKPLTPEMEAARKEYMRWLAHNLHPWTAP